MLRKPLEPKLRRALWNGHSLRLPSPQPRLACWLPSWLYLRQPGKSEKLATSFKGVYTTLLNKYYVDELYNAIIVQPLLWLSRDVFWKTVDVEMIDGTVNGIAHGTSDLGDRVRHTQSGNTRSYAVWVVIGALVILAIIFWPQWRALASGMVR